MRQVLPSRRSCQTFDLVFRNHRITLATGHFPDGRLGEVFLNIGKSGNDLDTIARDWRSCSARNPARRPHQNCRTRDVKRHARPRPFHPRRHCARTFRTLIMTDLKIVKDDNTDFLTKFKSKRSPSIAGVDTVLTPLPVMQISDANDWVRLHPMRIRTGRLSCAS